MSWRIRTVLIVLLVAYVAGLLVITLWPSTATTPGAAGARQAIETARSDGAPSGFTWASMEKLANLLVFIPIGALVALLVPRRLWVLGAVAGAALSAAIEMAQFLFLPGRYPSLQDLVVNSLGAVIGATLVAVARPIAGRRRARHTTRVSAEH